MASPAQAVDGEIVITPSRTHPAVSALGAAVAESSLSIKAVNGDSSLVVLKRQTAGVSAASAAPVARVVTAEYKKEIDVICADLKARQMADQCEPNYLYHATVTPNDSLFSQMYGLTKIEAPAAWDVTTGSRNVKVAVVDTGADFNHSELVAALQPGHDFVDGDDNPQDQNGHGTHVSGTIAAAGNNGAGTTGINWTTTVLAVRVLDANGSGTLSDVASGIDYARTHGADVINLSLGGPSDSTILRSAIQNASDAGILVAIAAGNESANNDLTPSYPADYNFAGTITVAATDQNDNIADFSNYGSGTVHIGAPGVGIISTVPSFVSATGYASFSGTSMATPHVAGVAALIKAIRPDLTGAQIKAVLTANGTPVAGLSGLTITGMRLNARAAIDAVKDGQSITPGSGGGSGGGSAGPAQTIELIETSRRSQKTIRLLGFVSDANAAAVAGDTVTITCNDTLIKSATTDIDGAFGASLRRQRRGTISCSAVDASGVVSNEVRVQPYKAASRRSRSTRRR